MVQWLQALESRHLAVLTFSELTRALRALSSAYVERRREGAPRHALDTKGKRAAFALFYGPLHFLTVTAVVRALGASTSTRIVDVGCGTGVAGAAWALAVDDAPTVLGVDRHHWAAEEAQWTYAQLGVRGRARAGDLLKLPRLARGDALVAAYVLNELAEAPRLHMLEIMGTLASSGVAVLVIEPISRRAVPWWEQAASQLGGQGFRADEWRFALERPDIVRRLDDASGLDHRILTARSLFHRGA